VPLYFISSTRTVSHKFVKIQSEFRVQHVFERQTIVQLVVRSSRSVGNEVLLFDGTSQAGGR
jgi:hypothetical protein